MTKISYKKHLPYSALQMYTLVADIESYPEFLPYCLGLKVLSTQSRLGKTIREAKMEVGYKLIKESFTTRVLEDPEAMSIRSSLVSGPFSALENIWRFEDCSSPNQCCIYLDLEYEFSSKLLEKIMGAAFDRFFNQFATAFENRADMLYNQQRDA